MGGGGGGGGSWGEWAAMYRTMSCYMRGVILKERSVAPGSGSRDLMLSLVSSVGTGGASSSSSPLEIEGSGVFFLGFS